MNKNMEVWVSPELADEISEGSVVTLCVKSLQKMGKGFIVSADGAIVNGSVKRVEPEEPAPAKAEPQESESQSTSVNLSGSSTPVQSFVTSAPQDNKPVENPVKKEAASQEAGLSFGERGPQLIGAEDGTPSVVEDESEPETQEGKKEVSGPKIIDNIESLYSHLKSLDPELLEESDDESPVTRSEAVAMESSGRLTGGFSAYIKNVSGGQLVLSDMDVRIRHGDSYNLGRVRPSKLIESVDLFEAVNGKLIEFVGAEEAHRINVETERRLARMEEDIGAVDVYDDHEDVYDDIEDSEFGDDPMPRQRVEGQRQQARQTADNRFRKGIRSAKDRRRQGYDAAAVPAPAEYRDMPPEDVTEGDDHYEFDEIFDGIERREAEISESPDIDWTGQ